MRYFDAKKRLEEHMEMCQALHNALVAAEDWGKLPSCHTCALGKPGLCKFLPKMGETVRFNCPLWEAK